MPPIKIEVESPMKNESNAHLNDSQSSCDYSLTQFKDDVKEELPPEEEEEEEEEKEENEENDQDEDYEPEVKVEVKDEPEEDSEDDAPLVCTILYICLLINNFSY